MEKTKSSNLDLICYTNSLALITQYMDFIVDTRQYIVISDFSKGNETVL